MRLTITLGLVLLAATAALADPVITSITPNSGLVAGGTTVIMKGSGFNDTCIVCSPPFADPEVFFLGTRAASVKLVDANTLEVVTPPHLPATVPVTVRQYDGSRPFTLWPGFTFTGDPNTAFDPILFPILLPPVKGAFGSEFHTTARVWNEDRSNLVEFYGFDTQCTLIDPPLDPLNPFPLAPRGDELTLFPDCSDSPGHILWVPKGQDSISANLRVRDVSREATSHGVEIPVVHREDFHDGSVSLLNVPIDPRFRNTLRIYGLSRSEVLVDLTFGNGPTQQLYLLPGESWFEPATLTFTDFPLPGNGPSTTRVVIDAPPGTPIWAFITVTNNDTQQITTITPN